MDAYFYQPTGRSFLEDLLSMMRINEIAQCLNKSPFVADYVDPFELRRGIYYPGKSLGFCVEKNSYLKAQDAIDIKKVYDSRGLKNWNYYLNSPYNLSEFMQLKEYRQDEDLKNMILGIWKREGLNAVIKRILEQTFPLNLYRLDFEEIFIQTQEGRKLSLGHCVRNVIRKAGSGENGMLNFYQIYLLRGGMFYAKTVMIDAMRLNNLKELADLIEWCPALGESLYDFSFDLHNNLEKLVEGANEDPNSKRIKEAIAPENWESYKKKYSDAIHFQECKNNSSFDQRAIEILQRPDVYSKPYVEKFLGELADMMRHASIEGDRKAVQDAESWLDAVDKAKITLEGTSSQDYRGCLKLRMEKLMKLPAHDQSDAASHKSKAIKRWLTSEKTFLIGAAGITAYFVYAHMKGSLRENSKKEPRSLDEAYERFENSLR
jgi:hypothetical protein